MPHGLSFEACAFQVTFPLESVETSVEMTMLVLYGASELKSELISSKNRKQFERKQTF